jgi:large subunit ribosomal protein L24e
MPICSFCNNEISKGTGFIYVLRDGRSLNFCSQKCKRNSLNLGREGRLMKWTNKSLVVRTEKKEVEKKESALAKDIEEKLKAKEAAKTGAGEKKK